MTAQDVMHEVESLGGAFRVEWDSAAGPQLLYRLGPARRNRTLAARLDMGIGEHGQEIGQLLLLRELFKAWEPAPGERVQ